MNSTNMAKLLPNAFLHSTKINFINGRIVAKLEGVDVNGLPVCGSVVFGVQLNGTIEAITIVSANDIPFYGNVKSIELPYETSYVNMESSMVDGKMQVEIKFYKPNPDESSNELYIHTTSIICIILRDDDTKPAPFSMDYVTLKFTPVLSL